MVNPYEQVIRELEDERVRIEQAIAVLQQRAPTGNGDQVVIPGPLSDDTTNEDAIDAVLARYPDLTTREIVEKAAGLGKALNINSVRWTLYHGVETGKYAKRKDGRANRYSMTKDS